MADPGPRRPMLRRLPRRDLMHRLSFVPIFAFVLIQLTPSPTFYSRSLPQTRRMSVNRLLPRPWINNRGLANRGSGGGGGGRGQPRMVDGEGEGDGGRRGAAGALALAFGMAQIAEARASGDDDKSDESEAPDVMSDSQRPPGSSAEDDNPDGWNLTRWDDRREMMWNVTLPSRVLSAHEIRTIGFVSGFLGQRPTNSTLQQFVTGIQALYARKGYLFCSVMSRSVIANGTMTLRAFEPKVANPAVVVKFVDDECLKEIKEMTAEDPKAIEKKFEEAKRNLNFTAYLMDEKKDFSKFLPDPFPTVKGRTKTSVINRALGLVPGEVMIWKHESWMKLLHSGLFEGATPQLTYTPDGRVMVIIIAKEPTRNSTGIAPGCTFDFGTRQIIGDVKFSDRNFLGLGQRMEFKLIRKVNTSFDVTLEDPMLGSPLSYRILTSIRNCHPLTQLLKGQVFQKDDKALGDLAESSFDSSPPPSGMEEPNPAKQIRPVMADTPPMPPPKQLPLGNIYDQGIFKFQLLTSAFKPWEICGGLSMNHSPVSKQIVYEASLDASNQRPWGRDSYGIITSIPLAPTPPPGAPPNPEYWSAYADFASGLALSKTTAASMNVHCHIAPTFPIVNEIQWLGGLRSVRGYKDGEVGKASSWVKGSAEVCWPAKNPVAGFVFTDAVLGRSIPGDEKVPNLREETISGGSIGAGVRIGPLRAEIGLTDKLTHNFHVTFSGIPVDVGVNFAGWTGKGKADSAKKKRGKN
ncbi:hypothetical protein AAMO2058_001473000 [Amorphochlora amoebiformis]